MVAVAVGPRSRPARVGRTAVCRTAVCRAVCREGSDAQAPSGRSTATLPSPDDTVAPSARDEPVLERLPPPWAVYSAAARPARQVTLRARAGPAHPALPRPPGRPGLGGGRGDLLAADLGVEATTTLVETLRRRVAVESTRDEATVRGWLREELLALVDPTMDRTVVSDRVGDRPAVVPAVGGQRCREDDDRRQLARVLVAMDKDVVLGAADTFRAAAADQPADLGRARRGADDPFDTRTWPTPPRSPSTP